MSVPGVETPEVDGGLGAVPATAGLPLVVIGQCVSGDFNLPQSIARVAEVTDEFAAGRAAEAAAYELQRYGKPAIVVRATTSVAHSYQSVDTTLFDGTSVPTADTAVVPNDDYRSCYLEFTAGGTIGTGGIKYRESLDGGRTFGPTRALGAATFITFADSGGVKVNFAAGTVVTGDILQFRAMTEGMNSDDLSDALDALAASSLQRRLVLVTGECDAAMADVVSAYLDAQHAAGKHEAAIVNFRFPTAGEEEADYLIAFDAAFGAFANTSMLVGAGVARVGGAIHRRRYHRAVAHPVAARLVNISEEQDGANINDGPLPGVSIRDANGNPEDHDESLNPGLDDSRATTLRTHPGETGVYANNAKLVSPIGSDFIFSQDRFVINEARTILDAFFRRRLSVPLELNPATGFVRESVLQAMEKEANSLLAGRLRAKPKVSSVQVTLSRNDPIQIPPHPLTGECSLVKLGVAKKITITIGYKATV